MPDPRRPDAHADLPAEPRPTVPGTEGVRFPLARWMLAPRTTWRARCLAADFGAGMDARTAWTLARLHRHPDEHAYAMAHLDDENRVTDGR
ncbi:hypothetical protein ACWEPZ_32230 [Streptomyces sp. NPDC004288]